MDVNITPASFASLTLMITGFTISLILWLFARVNNRSNKMLAAVIISITGAIAVGFMIETRLILVMPHFYRTDQLAYLISWPLAFLYVRSIVLKRGLQRADFIYFVPVLFYVIDFLPFFIRSGSEKIQLIAGDFNGYYAANDFDEGWLTPPGFQFYFRYLVIFFFWLLQLRALLLFYGRTTRRITASRLQSRSWLTYFLISQVFVFTPLFATSYQPDTQWMIAMISVGLPIPLATLRFFLRPEILYGLKLSKGTIDRNTMNNKSLSKDRMETDSKTPHEKEFADRLHEYMSKSKKFLQHRYTINRLATELDMPPHQISTFLNQHLNTSFSEFLNKYRIEYSIERIRNGDARRLTLEALASECGFNNRNSFTTAFKRFTGVTPSEFTKDLA